MRVALITNIPAPYRIPAWNIVGNWLKEDFRVFFCAHTEPNRSWTLPEMTFNHVFLKENYTLKKDKTTVVHNNRDIFKALKDFGPDIIVSAGFNPTMLYGFIASRLWGKKHIPITDAWLESEKHLGFTHQLLRKIIYKKSAAFLPCSLKGKEFFRFYGCREEDIFVNHIAINLEKYQNNTSFDQRPFDIMFSGQFIDRKNPMFFVRVAQKLKAAIPSLKVLLLGSGPLETEMIKGLNAAGVDYNYPGYASQDELPGYYSQSKIFLFPTSYDAWGVVGHESLAAGTPVITTPQAGCAGELILNDENGFVLPLDEELWVRNCLQLLQNKQQWQQFSEKARSIAAGINSERSAKAMISAFEHVTRNN